MKKLFLALLLFISHFSFGQHEAANWNFGLGCGMKFSGGTIKFFNSAISTTEGCSSISDLNDSLLFYTDGIKVWNRKHLQMPNGNGLLGDISSTQSALIVPLPDSNTLYYIFTTPKTASGGFHYSIVDITLQGGLGDVTTKNISLINPVSEKITAARRTGTSDIWIVTHGFGDSNFYAYLLSSSGLNSTPIISAVGSVHSGVNENAIGWMKISPCGSKLALALSRNNLFELFDFNASTGIVSNPVKLTVNNFTYGIEFSPDGNLLYADEFDEKIYQYNINTCSSDSIKASKILVGTFSPGTETGALQLAPNGKIYVATNYNHSLYNNFIGVINNPNVIGTGCNYVANGISISPHGVIEGLPNFCPFFFSSFANCGYSTNAVHLTSLHDTICPGSAPVLSVTGNSGIPQWQYSLTGKKFTDLKGLTDSVCLDIPLQTSYYRVYSKNGICSDTSAAYKVVVAAEPQADYSTHETGLTVTFNSTLSSGDIKWYFWDFGDGTYSSLANPIHTFSRPDTFLVCLTLYNSQNCPSTICNDVGVDISTETSKLNNQNNWNIYPNPTNQSFRISLDKHQQGTIRIYNCLGQLFYKNEISSEQLISTADFPSGNYYITLQTDVTVEAKKFMVVH